jgi:hypothetical protein
MGLVFGEGRISTSYRPVDRELKRDYPGRGANSFVKLPVCLLASRVAIKGTLTAAALLEVCGSRVAMGTSRQRHSYEIESEFV